MIFTGYQGEFWREIYYRFIDKIERGREGGKEEGWRKGRREGGRVGGSIELPHS